MVTYLNISMHHVVTVAVLQSTQYLIKDLPSLALIHAVVLQQVTWVRVIRQGQTSQKDIFDDKKRYGRTLSKLNKKKNKKGRTSHGFYLDNPIRARTDLRKWDEKENCFPPVCFHGFSQKTINVKLKQPFLVSKTFRENRQCVLTVLKTWRECKA